MAIHWQVKFKSLRQGEVYTVNIYDSTFSGTPVQLIGAAEPFVTQEDDDDDMFTPVRTQSGYIRIVDDGSVNWRDIIPTTDVDRPVTLTDSSGNVKWQGFMQAQNFGAQLYESPQERDFPVQCSLSVASRIDVETNIFGVTSFATLLLRIVNSIPETSRPQSFVVQGGAKARDILLSRFDWQNFLDVEDFETPKYNYLECLEQMCDFWGWTARTHADVLVLTCVDDADMPGALILDMTSLQSLSSGTSSGTIETMMANVSIGDIFSGVHNNDYQMRGATEATVKADAGNGDEEFLMAYPNSVMKNMYEGGFDDSHILYDYTHDLIQFSTAKEIGICNYGSFNIMRLRATPSREESLLPVIRIKNAYNGNTMSSFETQRLHVLNDGIIEMKANFYVDGEKFVDADTTPPHWGNKTMYMRLGIGLTRASAKWWTGVQWQDTQTTFFAKIGGNSDTVYTSNQKTSGSVIWNIPTGSLIVIPGIPDDIVTYGKVFVDFLGSDDINNGNKNFDIAEFKLLFHRRDELFRYTDPTRHDSFEYKSTTNNNVHQEWNKDTIFATENYSKFGYGVVLHSGNSYMTGFDYDGTGLNLERPEQHLVNRVTAYWAASKRKIECELLAHNGTAATVANAMSPRNTATIAGTTMYPISISREWRDDVVKLVLMEI